MIPDHTHLELPGDGHKYIVLVTDLEKAPHTVEGQLPGAKEWQTFTLQQSAIN